MNGYILTRTSLQWALVFFPVLCCYRPCHADSSCWTRGNCPAGQLPRVHRLRSMYQFVLDQRCWQSAFMTLPWPTWSVWVRVLFVVFFPRKLVLLGSSRNEQRRKGSRMAPDTHVPRLSDSPRGRAQGERRPLLPCFLLLQRVLFWLGARYTVCLRTRATRVLCEVVSRASGW